MRSLVLCSAALGAVLSTGCTPGLSTLQPAHVAPKNHWQVQFGVEPPTLGPSSDAIDKGVDVAVAAARGARAFTEAETESLYRLGAARVVSPFSVAPSLRISYTPANKLELNARTTGAAFRFGGRYQFLRQEVHRVDASLGAGAGYGFRGDWLGQPSVFSLEHYSRFQADASVLFGRRGTFYRAWGGPRLVYTQVDAELKLEIPNTKGFGKVERASVGGDGLYVGSVLGIAGGPGPFFLGIEVTVLELLMKTQLEIANKPTRTLDVGAFLVQPIFGFMVEF